MVARGLGNEPIVRATAQGAEGMAVACRRIYDTLTPHCAAAVAYRGARLTSRVAGKRCTIEQTRYRCEHDAATREAHYAWEHAQATADAIAAAEPSAEAHALDRLL